MKTEKELNELKDELEQVTGGTVVGCSEDFDLFGIKENPTFISIDGNPNSITCEDHQK